MVDCVRSEPNQVVNYFEGQYRNTSRVIDVLTAFLPPFITIYFDIFEDNVVDRETVCGPVFRLLVELSKRYHYGYVPELENVINF